MSAPQETGKLVFNKFINNQIYLPCVSCVPGGGGGVEWKRVFICSAKHTSKTPPPHYPYTSNTVCIRTLIKRLQSVLIASSLFTLENLSLNPCGG